MPQPTRKHALHPNSHTPYTPTPIHITARVAASPLPNDHDLHAPTITQMITAVCTDHAISHALHASLGCLSTPPTPTTATTTTTTTILESGDNHPPTDTVAAHHITGPRHTRHTAHHHLCIIHHQCHLSSPPPADQEERQTSSLSTCV